MGKAARAKTKPSPSRPAAAPPPARWPAYVLVAALAAGLYVNTLDGELFLDDRPTIIENLWVREGNLVAIFTHPSWWGTQTKITTWRPLTTLSFAMNHAVHGLEPRGYHVVNVLLHAAVATTLLGALAGVVPWLTAVAAAVVFAVHPIHTEAVANVTGRAELLSALGFFAAWWCFLAADAARRRVPRGPALALDAAGVACFLAGILGKENAITLLPVLLLTDAIIPAGGGIVATLRRRLPRYLALTIVAVLFVIVRVRLSGELAPYVPPLDNPLVALATASRLMTATAVVAYYALRLVFPFWLSGDYTAWQIEPVTSPLDPRFLAGLAVLLAVPVLMWWSRRRDPALALGLGLMAIPFVLISNLVFLIATIMAERWLYLPSAGFCLVGGAVLTHVVGTGGNGGRRLAVALALVATLFAIRTWTRNPVWHDPMVFFATLVETSPRSSLAHTGHADALAAASRYPEAFAEYAEALAIAPGNWRAEYNRGNALLATGDVAGAVAAYERTLALEPEFSKAMINLGAAESRRGNGAAAVTWLRRAVVLEPKVASVHTSLANILAANGDREGARAEFAAALALAPASPDVLGDSGAFLANNGAYADAITLLRRSLALAPNVADRHYNLGNALALSGSVDEAVAAYRQALSLRPNFPQAMENLGNTESLRGNHTAALEWLRRAEAAGANSAQLHTNIGNELTRLGRASEAQAEYEKAATLAR